MQACGGLLLRPRRLPTPQGTHVLRPIVTIGGKRIRWHKLERFVEEIDVTPPEATSRQFKIGALSAVITLPRGGEIHLNGGARRITDGPRVVYAFKAEQVVK